MNNRRRTARALGLAGLALALVAGPLAARSLGPVLYRCPPCLRVANAFVRADIEPAGGWVLGTTGGDPATPLDDDKRLLYGFEPGAMSQIGSSYSTIRIVGPNGTVDDVPVVAAAQTNLGDRVETVWLTQARYRVRVTETLRLDHNPFSGRPDVVRFRYDLHNTDTISLSVGVRALLDVRIGNNDGAPYIVPGIGAVTHEREFAGESVPPFWLAYESELFDPAKLRGIGILRGADLTPPSRMIIARWRYITKDEHIWDYPIDPTEPVTVDSAVALYWDPEPLPPRARRTVQSLFGEAGSRGGSAFLTSPVAVECGGRFVAALFVNNFDTTPLGGGLATLVLPPGLSLAPGEPATKALSTIAPGGTGSASWAVQVSPGDRGNKALSAYAVFDGGKRFEAQAEITTVCAPPSATPSPSATSTPTRSPAPTLTRTARPTATATPFGTPPAQQKACDYILGRVPAVAIAEALANPERVRGWREPLNPGSPIGPGNPLKTWLSLQNIAAPYHPIFNGLVYKVGCP